METRAVRVFVSSTFRDMQDDRNALQKFAFPKLRELCEARGVAFSDIDLRWGITEEEAARNEVLPLCLAEIEASRPFFIGLLGERYGSLPRAIDDALLTRQPWLSRCADRSVTELEIIHGVLAQDRAVDGAFFYFRDPAYAVGKDGFTEEDPVLRRNLLRLKSRIRDSGRPIREGYANPRALAEMVLADLTEAIDRRYPADFEPNWLAAAAADHEAYAADRSHVHLGRNAELERIDAHAEGAGPPLVVTGASGLGKSALLAAWALARRGKHLPAEEVVTHFVGASTAGAEIHAMLRRLIGEFDRRFELNLQIPDDPSQLRPAFETALHSAADKDVVILVIDGLDQLEDRYGALDLMWLPTQIPPTLRVVLSTLPGRPLDEVHRRGWPSLEIAPLSPDSRERLIEAHLAQYGKRLEAGQTSLLASAKQCGNPLFLRTVLDELRFEAKYDTLRHRIEHHLRAPDVPELLDQVLNRFETDYEDPQPGLVGAVMKLLWASRSGLAEFELLELLGTKESPLPAAYWSPLRVAADRLIVQRGGLLTFGHPHIRRAVETRYFGDPRLKAHVRWCLVSYFNADRRGRRSIHEFPWQLASLEDWSQLANLVAVPRFARALDKAEPGQLARYWTDIERHSDVQMVDAYRKVLDDPVAFGSAGLTIGNLLYRMGRIDEADAFFRTLEEAARAAGSSADTAVSLTMRGQILSDRGALKEAAACFTEAARITVLQGFDGHGSVEPYCSALMGLSAVLQRLGDIDGALARLDEAAAAADKVGLDDVRIVVLNNRAAVLMDRDEFSAALPVFEEVERLARDRDDSTAAASALTNQGIALFHLGDPARALQCHQRAAQLVREMGQRAELAACLLNEGTVLRSLREPDQAIACFSEAEALFTGFGDPCGAANARMNAATIHMDRNEKALALAECQSAARVFRQHGVQLSLATALKNSRRCMRDGQDEEALPISLELIEIYRAIDNEPELAEALIQHAVLLDNTNQTADAVTVLAEAADIYRALADGEELAKVCEARALVFEKLGWLDEAVVALAEAEEVARRLGDPERLREILRSEAALQYRRGDKEAAGRLATEAEKMSSTDPDQLIQHAITLQDRGFADEAIVSYDAAARGFRQSGRFREVGSCLIAIGLLRYQQGDLLAAVSTWLGAVEAYGHTDDTEGLDHAKAGLSLAGTDLVKDLVEKYKTLNSGSVAEVLALTRGALDAFRVTRQDRDALHGLHVRLLQQYAQQLAASDRLDDAKETLTELEAAQCEFHEGAAAVVTRGDIERLQRTGRIAAEPDEDADAAFHRGVMLDERGDLAGAEAAYRIAAGSTNAGVAPVAALNLGLLLVERGDNSGAEAAFRVAIDSGHRKMAPTAARNLGLILEQQGKDSAAMAAYRTALDFGHSESASKAAFSLGVLLDKDGDATGAEAAYRTAVECGESEDAARAAVNLGRLLNGRGDVSGAEDAFRAGMQSGCPQYAAMAANNLGLLLYEHGDVAGAEAAWRFAIDSGHPEEAPTAATNLGVLLAGGGDAAGAEAAYRIAIASGHPDLAPKAARNLGSMLIDRGDTAGAETALRIAIASGHAQQAPVAAFNLGVLLAQRGDAVGAEAAWRLVIQSGDQSMAAQAAKYIEMLH